MEFQGVDSLEPGIDAQPFWFLEFYQSHMFTLAADPAIVQTQRAFNERWGYARSGPWCSRGLTGSASSPNARDLTWLQRNHEMLFLPVTSILASCFFGMLTEMDLIEIADADRNQVISVDHGGNHGSSAYSDGW